MNIASILYTLVCISIGVTALKEFSLARYSDITVYANNSVININLVGEGFEGDKFTDGGALECHTDNNACCRGRDDYNGYAKGEWYYPNGTVVPPPNSGNSIYRTRGHMVIRLSRRFVTSPTGIYTCVIPGAGGVNITRYITLGASEGCDNLPLISRGRILYVPAQYSYYEEHYVGTLAVYTCSLWYQPVNGSVRLCVEGGVWNGTVACAFLCPINMIPNGREIITVNIATYSCDRGYELIGPSSRTCGDDGMWNTTSPPQCQIVDCGPLTDPANGQVNTPSGTTFGNTASYSCDVGYTLNGVNTRTCGSGGQWTNSQPSCNIVNCGPLPNISNGQVNASKTTFGSTASYSCNNGFTFIDNGTQICTASGKWTSNRPSCVCTSSLEITVGTVRDEASAIVGGSIGVLLFVSVTANILLVVYIICRKKNSPTQRSTSTTKKIDNQEVSTKVEGSEYEVVEGVGGMYEEVDKLREPHPPKGEYELSQCAAYGHVNIN